MFLEKNASGKRDKIIVGYDLSDAWSQISFCRLEEGEPETASVVAGEEQYNFPTMLCKRKEVNQWVYGREAMRLLENDKGIPVENLLTLAKKREPVEVGGEAFDPVALLALFMKKSLALLGMSVMPEQIDTVMITVETLDKPTIEVLTEAVSVMQIKAEHVYFQTYVESFYYYMINQPKELWRGQVILCDCNEERLNLYRMECNKRTTPVVSFVDESCYEQINGDDEALLQALEENMFERAVSSAYLIGNGFEGDWYENSLRYLCRGRRVFRGNNLYSKGACYGAREKRHPSDTRNYIFLGNDKLKANIGMKVLRRGEDSYFALMDAGCSWFEAKNSCDFILKKGNSISIVVTPLTGKESREVDIELYDLSRREGQPIRIHMDIFMKTENEVAIELTDMGFGSIYPASKKIWKESFLI